MFPLIWCANEESICVLYKYKMIKPNALSLFIHILLTGLAQVCIRYLLYTFWPALIHICMQLSHTRWCGDLHQKIRTHPNREQWTKRMYSNYCLFVISSYYFLYFSFSFCFCFSAKCMKSFQVRYFLPFARFGLCAQYHYLNATHESL